MKKYDYKVEQVIMHEGVNDLENYLKEMSKKGWRFAQSHPLKHTNIFIFEKEIESKINKK